MRVKVCRQIEDIYYTAKTNDTYKTIADKYCVPESDLREWNNNQQVYEFLVVYIKKRNKAIHIVKPLDTLQSIAQKYGVSIQDLQNCNSSTLLFVGKKLYIPYTFEQ